jgi:lipoprotein-releasing system permease protein
LLLLTGDQIGIIKVQTENADKVGEILAPLSRKLAATAIVADWRSTNSSLFEALEVERVALFVILSLIILVAAFNIVSSLIMLVRAKTRDIAIIRTMGAPRDSVLRIFVAIGVAIGVGGTVFGLILGFVALYFRKGILNGIGYLSGQNLWDPSVRFLTELPSKPNPVEIGVVVVMTIIFSFLATLYPAFKAANTDPVQVLRYE